MSSATGTVVVPALDEAPTVADTIVRIAAVLTAELPDRAWEILVVDDGSTDGTAAAARAAAATVERPGLAVRVLRHAANFGLGTALRTGFAASTGDVVVVLDCDLSYDPAHIPGLVAALADRQVAIASPYMAGGQALHVPRALERRSRLANRFLAAASNSRIRTFTGMVRAYDGPFLRSLSLKATDHRINVEILYKTQVMRGEIVEVPATLDWGGLAHRSERSRNRAGRSRAMTYRTMLDGVLFRPYLVFLAAAAAAAVAGVALLVVALLVPAERSGLLALGGALLLAGAVLAAASLLSIQVKRAFEELYFQAARTGSRAGRP